MNETGTKITTSEASSPCTARPISAVAARAASNGRHPLLLDEAEDVLEHHDRVVDDDADHQHQRQHGHAVEREVERPHHAERRDRPRPGSRRAAMIVERQLRMNASTTRQARIAAQHQVQVDLVQRRVDVARLVADDLELARRAAAAAATLRQVRLDASMTSTVLAPDCRRTSSDDGRHAVRAAASERCSLVPSSARPMSRTRIGAPLTVAITRSLNVARVGDAAHRAQRAARCTPAGDVAAGHVGVLARRCASRTAVIGML